ncbi:MAG: RHS repeat-associated core domain-containing protein, partial [Pseudobutyrivibrio sp.]|nr:RHS repeat-associated core domain-containing protein [Pseudobutyrivibrio sp.]
NGNIIQPLAFTGYREEESGHYYAQARSYDPRSGRFTGEDKVRGMIALPDTQNHYLYCLSNPIIMVDTNGLWPTVLIGAIGGAIAGAVIGGVSYAVGAAIKGEKIDVVQCVASAAGGAAVGSLMGAGVINPAVLGAAGGAASGYVNGVAQAAKDVKASIDRGDSIGDVALTCVKGLGTINESTLKGGLYGGALGTAIYLGGPVVGTAGALTFSAVSGGREGYKKEKQAVKDDPHKDSIDWGNVARYSAGQTVETIIGIVGFGALHYGFSKAGVYDTGTVDTNCDGENGSATEKTEYQNNLEKWGTSSDGVNQGERHFNDYWEKYPERIPSLEQRLGVQEGTFANNEEGFNNFTNQAETVIEVATENGTYKSVNGKEIYYVDGAANPKKGVVVIVKDGQIQSMMPSDPKSYGKMQ